MIKRGPRHAQLDLFDSMFMPGEDDFDFFDAMPKKSTMVPRAYQQEAIDKILWARNLSGNDLVILPTGAGKSLVIAKAAEAIDEEILVLQPSQEILVQNADKLTQYVPYSDIGIYSASLNRKEVTKFTFATIGSVYKKPELFKHIKTIFVDECHLVNQRNTDGMFTSFLTAIGKPKVVGLTASPYRNVKEGYSRGGSSYTIGLRLMLINRLSPKFWDRIIYNINSQELIEQGFLVPLDYDFRELKTRHKLNKQQTDYDLTAYTEDVKPKEHQIAEVIEEQQEQRKSILVFCATLAQASRLHKLVPNSAYVSGATESVEREKIVSRFKSQRIKTVFNVGVLTTGFDHPALDCIVLARPTKSLSLMYQMLGRGVRTSKDKTSCHCIDFTDSVKKLGRIETIKLTRPFAEPWQLTTETGSWHNRLLYSFDREY